MTSKFENSFLKDVHNTITTEEFDSLETLLKIRPVLDALRNKSLEYVERLLYVELNSLRRSDHIRRIYQRYRKLYWFAIDEEFTTLYDAIKEENDCRI